MSRQPYTHEWYLKNKVRIRKSQRKYYLKTKARWAIYSKKWRKKNLVRVRHNRHAYYLVNKQRTFEQVKEYRRTHPVWWRAYSRKKLEKYKRKYPIRFALCKRLSIIRQRCINPKYKDYPRYGGKGTRCFLTLDELELLWNRDKAHRMRWPSIDRLNPDGHYEYRNCRFIEFTENISRASKRRWSKLRNG